jgi:hypothetical protein
MKNIVIIEKAVADNIATDTLYLARFSGGSSLRSAGPPPDLCGSMSVEVTTIDEFMKNHSDRGPALVKVDVEGGELSVLKGMKETLARFKPTVLFEVDAADMEKVRAKATACNQYLQDIGYHITELADSYAGMQWKVRHYLAIPARDGRS